MIVLYVLILAVIQGITEYLPVSSFGHLCMLEKALGMQIPDKVLLSAVLHLGTSAAAVLAFRKDFRMIVLESAGMIQDLLSNFSVYIYNRKNGENRAYSRIVNNTYRRLTALLLVSMIPTVFLGYSARRLVEQAVLSPVIPQILLLITGIYLLVMDLGQPGGTRSVRDSKYDQAMWIGISQGLAVFPGLSRSGLTICTGLLVGLNRKFAVKYSYLLLVFASMGAFCVEVPAFASADMTVGLGFLYVGGMIVSAVVGYFVIRLLIKVLCRVRLRYFAIYCFVAGMIGLIGNYL